MSYHILSESENSFERTIVYQTRHENFVVIVQEKRLNEQEDWTTKDHCMLPKFFVNFIAQLPDKPQSTSGGFITSGGILPPSTLSDPVQTYDISNLPAGTKKIIYKYDCDCFPFYENQLGVLQECDNLADLWGFQNLQNHPSIHLQNALLRQTLAPRWAQTAHSQAHLFPQVWKTTICGSTLTAHKLWAIIYCATYLATILKLLYKAPATQSRKILRPKISQKRLRTQKTPQLTMLRKKEKIQQCENSLTDLNNFFIEVNIKLL